MLGGSSALLFSMLVAASSVEVRGTVICPSTTEVMEGLPPLLPQRSADGADRHLATLEEVGPQASGHLRLRLLRSDASVIGERYLVRRGTCQAMAQAIAVVIAAWETEPLSDAPVPVAAITHEEASALSSPARSPERSAVELLGGVSAGTAFWGGIAAVGNAEAQGGRTDSHWRLRLALIRESSRRIALGAGHVDWQHTMVVAGLLVHGSVSAWVGSLDAGVAVGWTGLQGNGYEESQQKSSFTYGVVGGVRGGRRFGRWTVWAEARTIGWLRGQRALLTNAPGDAEPPRGDVSASAGTTFQFF